MELSVDSPEAQRFRQDVDFAVSVASDAETEDIVHRMSVRRYAVGMMLEQEAPVLLEVVVADDGSAASQPRAASSFSFDRKALHLCLVRAQPGRSGELARSGRPASAATASRSRYDRASTDASEPSRHGGAPIGEACRGCPAGPSPCLSGGSAAAGSRARARLPHG
jgi:hypothetical protein